jgi:hypothetical protein
MELRRLFLNYVSLFALIISVGLLSYVFFFRPPVILVSDIYSSALYGADWERMRLLSLSLKILRPVHIYRLMEETDSKTISENIIKANSKPHSVFFPGRFSDAAQFYGDDIKEQGNQTTKAVLCYDSSRELQAHENIIIAVNGPQIDYYRAGYSAALLAKDYVTKKEKTLAAATTASAAAASDPPSSVDEGEIVFIYDTQPTSENSDAFIRGTAAAGFTGTTNFSLGRDSLLNDRVSCFVIEGPPAGILGSTATQPMIILTWFYNKNYLRQNIKVQIDDSPYALIPKVLKERPKTGSTISIPADFIILDSHIKDRALSASLRRAASRSQINR